MASKGTKRAATTAATTAKKLKTEEAKVDPAFAGIIATLQDAENLPEGCRQMLVAMVAPSLSAPKNERHSVQALGVSLIEETLREAKEKLANAIAQEQKKLDELDLSKASLVAHLEAAEVDLASKTAIEQAKQASWDEATKAVQEGGNCVSAAKESVRKSAEPLADLRAEKTLIEELFRDHFKAPMDANEGPHFDAIEPHIHKLALDESLAIALPSSCAKKGEARGGFDTVVLGELEKALQGKIESLSNDVKEHEPKVAECQAAVLSAETALEEKTAAEKAAAQELEAAKAAREDSAAELCKAKENLAAISPGMQQVTDKQSELTSQLRSFEEGPLATFEMFRDKTTVEEEAAHAGA